jgi:hypothetical protein
LHLSLRLNAFSFLIMIASFATLEGMKIKSTTPMHHPDEHGQFRHPRLRS